MLKKEDIRSLTGLNWFRIETSGDLMWL